MKKIERNQATEQLHFDKLARETGHIWWGSVTPAGVQRLRRRACLIREVLAAYSRPAVLEIGCGTGALTRYILELIPGLDLQCADISPISVQTACRRYSSYGNVDFLVADAANMPYADTRFDAIIGNSILHHIPVVEALCECKRVLRPGGRIVFFEPNMCNPQIAVEKNIHFIGRKLQNTETETAFFRWKIFRLLREAGFTGVFVTPFDFLHPATPPHFITAVASIGAMFERVPILKEVAGSLIITGVK
ncbi:MAG TPA: methyltransferase domain-containing protein [Candidatus Omnitrophota bacterium]|nr:methyltransferase domain-containing protein [Candidatus Omnitrophota bacterium]HNQ50819.1 methyltransferase domain-containing protein [Candidatus Omnitrophota bacterium]